MSCPNLVPRPRSCSRTPEATLDNARMYTGPTRRPQARTPGWWPKQSSIHRRRGWMPHSACKAGVATEHSALGPLLEDFGASFRSTAQARPPAPPRQERARSAEPVHFASGVASRSGGWPLDQAQLPPGRLSPIEMIGRAYPLDRLTCLPATHSGAAPVLTNRYSTASGCEGFSRSAATVKPPRSTPSVFLALRLEGAAAIM